MELPISTIEFFKSVGASAGAAASASVAASAAGSTTAVGAVSVVSGTGSATFMSSGEATEGPALREVAQPILLDFGARGRSARAFSELRKSLFDFSEIC
jgi:hypothetical protein